MHTTVDAETKTRKTRAGMPRRTPDRGAIRAEVEKRPDKANVQEADGAFTTFCRMGLHPWQKASGELRMEQRYELMLLVDQSALTSRVTLLSDR